MARVCRIAYRFKEAPVRTDVDGVAICLGQRTTADRVLRAH